MDINEKFLKYAYSNSIKQDGKLVSEINYQDLAQNLKIDTRIFKNYKKVLKAIGENLLIVKDKRCIIAMPLTSVVAYNATTKVYKIEFNHRIVKYLLDVNTTMVMMVTQENK